MEGLSQRSNSPEGLRSGYITQSKREEQWSLVIPRSGWGRLFYSLLEVESTVKTGPPPVKGWGLWVVVFMPRSSSLITIMVDVGVIIAIIEDPWSSWQVSHCQINIDCGHHRRWPWSSSSESSPRAHRAWRRASSACRASNTSWGISRSCGRCCLPRAIVESGHGLEVNYRIDKSIEVGLRAVVALVRSQRCRSRSRSKSWV
jgi:hypothetical protein